MSHKVMKVMYLADSYENPFAGTEGQMRMLIEGLDRKRFDPQLTLLRASDYIVDHGFPCPVNVLDIGSMASIASIRKINQFAKKLKDSGVNLVHIFFNDSSIIAPLFLKLRGIKVIISRRDMGYWYTAATIVILKLNSLLINHVVVNSKAVKDITRKKEGVSKHKITVIYNGYEDEIVTPEDDCDNLLLSGVNEDDLVLGLVANVRPLKRIEDVIRAMPKILINFPNAKFVHVGGGDISKLRELTKSLNVAGSVVFVGQQSCPKKYMRRFDVAILCSESEGFSNAIIEYMKCHNPVICTDVGGNSEIVVDGETGYLFKVGDFDTLAGKVIELFSDAILRKKFSDNGYTLAEERFKKQNMLKQHELLYERIVSA